MSRRVPQPQHIRVLGFWSLWALGINGVVGTGIFFVPRQVAELVPGAWGSMVYGLTAVALLPVAFTYASLGSRFAEDGGPYVWARAAFGSTIGSVVGWAAYLSAVLSASAVMAGLGRLLWADPMAARATAWGATLVLSGVVAVGLRPTVLVWNVLTVSKLLPLLALLGAAVWTGLHLAGGPLLPSVLGRSNAVWRAMLVVVFATQGFEIVVVPAGQVRNSRRAVPGATLGSLLCAAVLYTALHAACVSAVPDLAQQNVPLVKAASVYGGQALGTLVGYGTLISTVGIAFGMMAMTPRYLVPLGELVGRRSRIGDLDARLVPRRALVVTMAAVLLLVTSEELEQLFVLSSVMVLVQYGVSAAALFRLAWRRERGLRLWQIWPALFSLATILMLAQAASPREVMVASSLLALGSMGIWAWRRGHGEPTR